ncbi:MAG: response regulator transcription factor [Bacteroidia bacterium]|nr:response regulator transcription factor [Bacteroidia bacterium]
MRAIIVDDEVNNINNLQLLLQQHCPQVHVIATASSAEEAEQLILLHQPDLLFLDIQMPGKSGFDLLRSLPDPSFEIIFITGFDKYGIQAVRFSAIDYLLKPIVVINLVASVERASKKIAAKMKNRQLENLMEFIQKENNKKVHKIALPSAKEIRFVYPGEIVCCEAKNNYTLFHLEGGEKLVISKPIYEYEELLAGYGFIRCHNSYLVNKEAVKSILKEDGTTYLITSGLRIPVSRQKREFVREYLFGK